MHSDLTNNSALTLSQDRSGEKDFASKQPQIILQNVEGDLPHKIAAFPPNRSTLGGTAYFIVGEANILVDCPAWNDTTRSFLQDQGGVQWLFLTHRGSISNVQSFQQAFNCKVLIQEQEAYLLPGVAVTQFEQAFTLTSQCSAIWTAGHSPGSSCLYDSGFGGVLFSGRHLLPTPQGKLLPLKTAKTFHWHRQLDSVQQLRDRFTSETLQYICPGANIGFLRGQYVVEQAHEKLIQMDLTLQS